MLCPKERCTACCACFAACPTDAISMIENELSELKPTINETKCIHCDRCSQVCPILNTRQRNNIKSCFALYTKDENDRKTCASGGMATTLGRYIINLGGVVFGAVWENNIAVLKKADKQEQLDYFKGSKYVYVFPGKIYRIVKNALISGKLCLFVGTPCQIDGLRSYLGEKYNNLITIDLICHGVPPMAYLNEYVTKIKYKEKIKDITFRGQRDFCLTLYDENKHPIYSKKQSEDMYFVAFLNGLIQRTNCFSCPYAGDRRVSDITIGDFWGLEKNALNDYRGRISVALVNSEKGNHVLQEISNNFVIEKRNILEAVSGNAQLRRPLYKHKDRDIFLRQYKAEGDFINSLKYTSIYKEVRKNRMRNKLLKVPRAVKHSILKKKS